MHTFQSTIRKLSAFWESKGALIYNPYDIEKGAGTSNPATFLRSLGPEPFNVAYIEPCRRPKDGRYGTNPNRLQHYFQYQVILKPSPDNIQDLYLESLQAIGLNLDEHDIRFVHDDWENPTLGAWGLGWEVWIDGMESSQFTYFQAIAGIPLNPIAGEITYGIERLAMYLQNVDSIFDLKWNDSITYGDLYKQNEIEGSRYNFEEASIEMWSRHFTDYRAEAKRLIEAKLPIPAYDFVVKASHSFNILDARGAISVSERANYISEIRELARLVAEGYLESRQSQGFPLLKYMPQQKSAPVLTPSQAGSSSKREDLLIEIGCEELPATFVEIGRKGLEEKIKDFFQKHSISYSSIQSYATPRRLAVIATDVETIRPETRQSRRGPALSAAFNAQGSPLPAALGFFKSVGIDPQTLEEIRNENSPISIQQHQGADYLFADVVKPSLLTSMLLEEELPARILSIEFPKSMRWGSHSISFARPIRWIIGLLGRETLNFAVGHIPSSKQTFGHRQLAPQSFVITEPKEYLDKLKEHYVLVDQNERRSTILQQIEGIEAKEGASALYKERVLEQVINLVEWPELTVGTFDTAFLKAPEEILSLEMVEHQKYFPLKNKNGLIAKFVITANNKPTDLIRAGNKKVLSARLSDGRFLWDEDKKIPLEEHAIKNQNRLFFTGLGTVQDKSLRLFEIVQLLHSLIPHANLPIALEAAALSKADLATHVIDEFPELQGTMGRLLAETQGKPPLVAKAIEEHWLPKSENGPVPETLEGALLALSDKADTLLGFFGLGKKPTSSQDPFALRRQAIGVIKILFVHRLPISLETLLSKALPALPEAIRKQNNALISDIVQFCMQRCRGLLIDEGYKKEEVDAVLARQSTTPLDALSRLEALSYVMNKDIGAFTKLLEVFRRSSGQIVASGIDCSKLSFHNQLLSTPEENRVLETLNEIEPIAAKAFESQNYVEFLEAISKLEKPLDTLFSNVKILSDDEALKTVRLALLYRIYELFNQFAEVKLLYGLLPKGK